MYKRAERYDRELKDIFKLQDEITLEIITALQVELTEGEQSRILRGGTTNLEAFLKIKTVCHLHLGHFQIRGRRF